MRKYPPQSPLRFQITVLDNAVLSVKGGSAGRMRGVCGAGGVIQIIGSCGKILNKSRVIFENGRSTCGNDMIDPGIGTLIIKGISPVNYTPAIVDRLKHCWEVARLATMTKRNPQGLDKGPVKLSDSA